MKRGRSDAPASREAGDASTERARSVVEGTHAGASLVSVSSPVVATRGTIDISPRTLASGPSPPLLLSRASEAAPPLEIASLELGSETTGEPGRSDCSYSTSISGSSDRSVTTDGPGRSDRSDAASLSGCSGIGLAVSRSFATGGTGRATAGPVSAFTDGSHRPLCGNVLRGDELCGDALRGDELCGNGARSETSVGSSASAILPPPATSGAGGETVRTARGSPFALAATLLASSAAKLGAGRAGASSASRPSVGRPVVAPKISSAARPVRSAAPSLSSSRSASPS